jgi:NADH:ubiquinone oxidoreductase subunit K
MVSAGFRSPRIGEMEERDLAVALARGRIAFGVVSLLAPGLVARTMTSGDESGGGTRLFVRMVGARDLAVGLGLQVALHRDAPTRGWLEASAVIDGIDAAASVLARHHLRRGVFPGTLGLAVTGTLLSAWLARQLDPAPSAPSQHASQ